MLLQVYLLVPFARLEEIVIPWTSSSFDSGVFVVLLGDDILFHPCGDSNLTNLVYTNSKEVFEQFTPPNNISSDVIYDYVGGCSNRSGQLAVLVRTGIVGVSYVTFENYGTFFFLSDYGSDCQNGWKAVVIVSEVRP